MSTSKDQDGERCVTAKTSVDIYQQIDNARDKSNFLKEFIEGGGGKGKDSLKFIYKYCRTISRAKVDSSSSTLQMLNRHI